MLWKCLACGKSSVNISFCYYYYQLSSCMVAPCFHMTNKSEFSGYIKATFCPSKKDFIRYYWFLTSCKGGWLHQRKELYTSKMLLDFFLLNKDSKRERGFSKGHSTVKEEPSLAITEWDWLLFALSSAIKAFPFITCLWGIRESIK